MTFLSVLLPVAGFRQIWKVCAATNASQNIYVSVMSLCNVFLSSLHSWKAKTIPVSFSLGFWVPSFRIRQWQKNCCNHAIISTSLHGAVMLQAISDDFSKKNCGRLCYMIWIMPSVSTIFYPHMQRHSKMCYLLHFPLRLSLQQHQQFCPKVRERSDYSVAVFYLTQ